MSIPVKDLKFEKQKEYLIDILGKLKSTLETDDYPAELYEDFLLNIVQHLDLWGDEDVFGTQGWEYIFGYGD